MSQIEDSKKRSRVLVRTRDKWTNGLAITNKSNDLRFFLFETDSPFNQEHYDRINRLYDDYSLDYLNHRTGDGIHWLSPSLLSLETWKEMMEQIKDINPKCPMTTLRIEPNKYINEREIWFTTSHREYTHNLFNTSIELSLLLNHWFGTSVYGDTHTDLQKVRYPFK